MSGFFFFYYLIYLFVFMNHKLRAGGGFGFHLLELNFILGRHACSPSDELLNWSICKVRLNCVLCTVTQQAIWGPLLPSNGHGPTKWKVATSLGLHLF